MFVKGKAAFQFARPHDGKACAIGKAEIFVGVLFRNNKSRILNRRGQCDNFNEAGLLQVLPEKNSDMMQIMSVTSFISAWICKLYIDL
jgi:hypothetical protein